MIDIYIVLHFTHIVCQSVHNLSVFYFYNSLYILYRSLLMNVKVLITAASLAIGSLFSVAHAAPEKPNKPAQTVKKQANKKQNTKKPAPKKQMAKKQVNKKQPAKR